MGTFADPQVTTTMSPPLHPSRSTTMSIVLRTVVTIYPPSSASLSAATSRHISLLHLGLMDGRNSDHGQLGKVRPNYRQRFRVVHRQQMHHQARRYLGRGLRLDGFPLPLCCLPSLAVGLPPLSAPVRAWRAALGGPGSLGGVLGA